jgi:hypothetical protein
MLMDARANTAGTRKGCSFGTKMKGVPAAIMGFVVLPHEVLLLILKAAPGAPHLRLICWRWHECWLEVSKGRADAWVADWRVTVASIPLAQIYIDLMPCKAWLCSAAAAAGRLDMLQWARAQGCPWSSATCEYAAAEGYLEILDWAVRNGCPLSYRVGIAAASRGRLEVLQWLQARSCQIWLENCGEIAAQGGHLGVVRWAVEQALRDNNSSILRAVAWGAAHGGHLALLQWVAARCDSWQDPLICTKAAQGGHLEVLRWAYEQRCGLERDACIAALREGHAEVFQWAFTHMKCHLVVDCDRVTWDGFEAARGRLGILQWLHANRSLLGAGGQGLLLLGCEAAALAGDIEALQWAADSCDLSPEDLCFNALATRGAFAGLQAAYALFVLDDDKASSLHGCGVRALVRGHPETVRWLAGWCDVDEKFFLQRLNFDWTGWPGTLTLGEGTASRQRLLGMLEWWARRSDRAWTGAFCAQLAAKGDLELLQWAHTRDFPWDGRVCESVVVQDHSDVVAWAHANRCPCKHARRGT